MTIRSSSAVTTHVFIFRHCIRSTRETVNLHGGKGEEAIASYFVSSTIPNWNTPEEWCTEHGVKVLQQTGKWLKKHYAIEQGAMQLISDTSQRDVESSFALSQGWSSSNTTTASRSSSTSSASIELKPTLFHATLQQEPHDRLCTSSLNNSIIARQIQHRLDTIPPPSSLSSAMEILRKYMNKHAPSHFNTTMELDKVRLKLTGPVNLVTRFAEMALFSRMSNITTSSSSSFDMVDEKDLAKLVPWIAWERSILYIGNSDAASMGAIMSDYILKNHFYQASNTIVLVGHDSTLNGLQTVWGVENWTLPFYGANFPTPPGSALHMMFSHHGGGLELEFLYPKYSDTSGALTSLPLIKTTTYSRGDLKQQNLNRLEGAAECVEEIRAAAADTTTRTTTNDGVHYLWILGGLVLVISALVCLKR